MRRFRVFIYFALALAVSLPLIAQEGRPGEKLYPANIGKSWIESMDAAIERDALITDRAGSNE